jgi:Biotin-lipoyl like
MHAESDVYPFAVSIGASALGGALGMPSGIFIVPFLTLFEGVSMHSAVACSIVSVIACSGRDLGRVSPSKRAILSAHRHAGAVSGQQFARPGFTAWVVSLVALGLVAGGLIAGPQLLASPAAPAAPPAPPSVSVSEPVQRDVAGRLEFLGQFSAVQSVELRAQVGGTLTQIGFRDGDIVHRDDLLFEIDPTPYQIKLSGAVAQAESASTLPTVNSSARTR